MSKKKVVINEDINQIKYYEKDPKSKNFIDFIFNYICSSSETIESPIKYEKNLKKKL